MKQVLIRQGKATIEDIPAPQVEAGTILVEVDHSCISIGTEISGVKNSGLPLWKRALKQPDQVKKAFELAASLGVSKTRSLIQGRLTSGSAVGYSAAGTVLEVGNGITDIFPGDRVACAGAQCAHHAEIIRVPRNLTVPLPDRIDFASASTVTLGAIALQGVRRAQPTLGETFAVLGLGILGQLAVQLLKANGCRVIGVDLDRARVATALKLGLDIGIHPDDGDGIDQAKRFSDGRGADGVIITASTSSDDVISSAFRMCRKKGRVVLVGDVGLKLDRRDIYEKELDFFVSTSYGPGRYDDVYEEKGIDYPFAYVRWTENRNMAEYLRLIAEERVRIEPLVSSVYPISRATEAYESLKNGSEKPLMVLLSYPEEKDNGKLNRVVTNPTSRRSGSGQLRIALVGAGGFAKGMHLPNIQSLSDRFYLQAVMSRTGHNATATAEQFGAGYATTDYRKILEDSAIEAVIIATRHNLHAPMTLEALMAGKHVLLEKPLALCRDDLAKIEAFYSETDEGKSKPILLTGFNRRFSRYARRISELIRERSNPMIINYRMNAGYIPLNHWVHGDEGGGRNLGEACHIYDLFTFLTASPVISVQASSVCPATGHYIPGDNFTATMTFSDGSVATLTYTALGCKEYPKELMEIFVDGKVIVLEDYRLLKILGAKAKGIETKISDKGQKDELIDFFRAIRDGGEWPIPLWQQIQATEISFQVERQLGGYQ